MSGISVRYSVGDVGEAIPAPDVVTGPDGSQVMVDDPSGNPVELFQAAARHD